MLDTIPASTFSSVSLSPVFLRDQNGLAKGLLVFVEVLCAYRQPSLQAGVAVVNGFLQDLALKRATGYVLQKKAVAVSAPKRQCARSGRAKLLALTFQPAIFAIPHQVIRRSLQDDAHGWSPRHCAVRHHHLALALVYSLHVAVALHSTPPMLEARLGN